jgi:putative ABC transport system ATP-binding protein
VPPATVYVAPAGGPAVEALRMDGVGLDLPGRPGVLSGIGLALAAGELAVLEGRSGSGKSSLLAVAAGLLPPTAGSVRVMGEPVDARDPAATASLRARHVGLVFQHLHLLAELTVQENVELPLRLRHEGRAAARARAAELLATFGLEGLAGRFPPSLSGGEQQRVAIARALAPRPGLLLVDEPTSSLDRANSLRVGDALRQAAASGAAVLVATHDPLLHRLGRLVRIDEGRLLPAAAGAR